MTEYDAYVLYLALRLHFNDDGYDFHRYKGKVKVDPQIYSVRPDRWRWQKLAKEKDAQGYLVANFLHDPEAWIGDMREDVYVEWLKVQQALTYIFKEDLKRLPSVTPGGNHPRLLKAYITKKIKLETLVVCCQLIPSLVSTWDRKLGEDPVWRSIRRKVLKYSPFVRADKTRFVGLMVNAKEALDDGGPV